MKYLCVVVQQLLKTSNRKQENTDNVLSLVENYDIMLEIGNKLSPFERISNSDSCDVMLILKLTFFSCPHNYYCCNNYVAK